MALFRVSVPNSSELTDLTFEVLSIDSRETMGSATATE